MSRRIAGVSLIGLLLLLVLGGCGSSKAGPAKPPAAASTVPPTAVAVVDGVPITVATFRHWLSVLNKTQGAFTTATPKASADRRQLSDRAMGLLVRGAWVLGEAARRHVSVTPAAVRRQLRIVKRAEFPRRGAYSAYLRRSGQTTADLEYHLRIQLLTARLKVPEGSLNARWRQKTTCSPTYAVAALCRDAA